MNLLADEGVDRQIVNRLRREGHDILYIAEMEPGMPDEAVLESANRESRLLLTADKDFGELVFRQRRITPEEIRRWRNTSSPKSLSAVSSRRDSRFAASSTASSGMPGYISAMYRMS